MAAAGRCLLAILAISPVIDAVLAVCVNIVFALTVTRDRKSPHEHQRNLERSPPGY